jgi:hypothetical protein
MKFSSWSGSIIHNMPKMISMLSMKSMALISINMIEALANNPIDNIDAFIINDMIDLALERDDRSSFQFLITRGHITDGNQDRMLAIAALHSHVGIAEDSFTNGGQICCEARWLARQTTAQTGNAEIVRCLIQNGPIPQQFLIDARESANSFGNEEVERIISAQIIKGRCSDMLFYTFIRDDMRSRSIDSSQMLGLSARYRFQYKLFFFQTHSFLPIYQ